MCGALLCGARGHEAALNSDSQHNLQDVNASITSSSDVNDDLTSALSALCMKRH